VSGGQENLDPPLAASQRRCHGKELKELTLVGDLRVTDHGLNHLDNAALGCRVSPAQKDATRAPR
jgi:hypothetical protein